MASGRRACLTTILFAEQGRVFKVREDRTTKAPMVQRCGGGLLAARRRKGAEMWITWCGQEAPCRIKCKRCGRVTVYNRDDGSAINIGYLANEARKGIQPNPAFVTEYMNAGVMHEA